MDGQNMASVCVLGTIDQAVSTTWGAIDCLTAISRIVLPGNETTVQTSSTAPARRIFKFILRLVFKPGPGRYDHHHISAQQSNGELQVV
jgi:hypothetical protein